MRNVRVSFKVLKIGKFIITNKQQTSQLFISVQIILLYLIKLFPVMAKPFEILQKALVVIIVFRVFFVLGLRLNMAMTLNNE